MKKILLSLLALLLSISTYAQKDVTTFLGIPIDGTKGEMRQKLIAKGFTPLKVGDNECFKGEFNGTDVNIYIGTNNNKVYRLAIFDVNTQDEAQIKIRFNNLVSQFENNKRYIALEKYTISDAEDISFEMSVHVKNFDAEYYQKPDINKIDTAILKNKFREQLSDKFTPEQLKNPTNEMSKEFLATAIELFLKKHVWFRIEEYYGKYYIAMYYDNEYNHANGEDL